MGSIVANILFIFLFARLSISANIYQYVRLHSHQHEYKSGTARVPANTSLRVFWWRPFTYMQVQVTCKFYSYK